MMAAAWCDEGIMRQSVVLWAGVGASILFGTCANADVHPAFVDNNASADFFTSGVITESQSFSNSDLSTDLTAAVSGSSATLVVNQAVPSLLVSESSVAEPYGFLTESYAASDFTYFYEVVGADGPVPVDIAYSLSLITTGSGTGQAEIAITPDFPAGAVAFFDGLFSTAETPDVSASTSNTFHTIAFSGQDNEVELDAGGGTIYDATLQAFVDPHIFIDPSYLAANPGVSLEISDGVGNIGPSVSAVPEPATWALMLVGFGSAGAMLRTARRQRASA